MNGIYVLFSQNLGLEVKRISGWEEYIQSAPDATSTRYWKSIHIFLREDTSDMGIINVRKGDASGEEDSIDPVDSAICYA